MFEARHIKRMELIVMKTLKWRLQAVTPFSFIGYFLDKFNEGKPPSYTLASWCSDLTVGTLKGLIILPDDLIEKIYLHCQWQHLMKLYLLEIYVQWFYRL